MQVKKIQNKHAARYINIARFFFLLEFIASLKQAFIRSYVGTAFITGSASEQAACERTSVTAVSALFIYFIYLYLNISAFS